MTIEINKKEWEEFKEFKKKKQDDNDKSKDIDLVIETPENTEPVNKDKKLEIAPIEKMPEEIKEKNYKCAECGYEFDEFLIVDGEECCPKCKAPLETG